MSDVLRFSGTRFPVQSDEGHPKSVPWAMVAEHEAQALKNHQQTLARLAERGGLGPDELWCVIHDQPFAHRPRPEWCDAWLSGINDLRVALVQAVHAERIAREPVAAVPAPMHLWEVGSGEAFKCGLTFRDSGHFTTLLNVVTCLGCLRVAASSPERTA